MAKISDLPQIMAPDGQETVVVLDAGVTRRVTMGPLVDAAAAPAIDRATTQADRAEAGALAALLAMGDGIYDDDVAAGLAATAPDGSEAFYNVGSDGQLDAIVNDGGVAKVIMSLPTRKSLRSNGINLWEAARRGASTDPADMAETTATIASVIEDASRWGIGLINAGGAEKVYHCGGAFPTLGTWQQAQPDGTIKAEPFRRGLIPLRSNVEIRGLSQVSQATFRLAPGYTNPGGIFDDRFWEREVQNVAFRWVRLDGNTRRQIVTPYKRGTSDMNMWFHGNAVTAGSILNLRFHECAIHGWQGHGAYHFVALDYDRRSEGFTAIGCEFYDNLMGAGQLAVNRIHTERNVAYGDGGATALLWNVEVHDEREEMLDIASLYERVYANIGLSPTINTCRDYNGFAGFDSDHPDALAARTQTRRAYWLSGNYVTPPTADRLFKRQRGRIHIVGMKTRNGTIGGAGVDRVHIIDPQIEIDVKENVLRQFPGVGSPINLNVGTPYEIEGYDEVVIRGAMISSKMDVPAVVLGNYRRIDVEAQVSGGEAPALRLELCGGRARISARDVGRVVADADPTLRGQHGAAVAVFGGKGPLDLDVQAIDTRAGDARQLQHAIYANVGRDYVVTATGSVQGQTGVAIRDPNGNIIDRGLIDAADRVQRMTGPVAIGAALTVAGNLLMESATDNVGLTLRAPQGKTSAISFTTPDGLEGQIIFLTDGALQMQIHEKGVFTAAPLSLLNDGSVLAEMNWQRPVRERTTGRYLWLTAGGELRAAADKPSADNDGTLIGPAPTGA